MSCEFLSSSCSVDIWISSSSLYGSESNIFYEVSVLGSCFAVLFCWTLSIVFVSEFIVTFRRDMNRVS